MLSINSVISIPEFKNSSVDRTNLYTFNMSKKINEIWGRKYVPKEDATLVFVCNLQVTKITIHNLNIIK